MYKVVSLFSGCGGADLGIIGDFEFNGKKYDANPFELEYAVDIERTAFPFHHVRPCRRRDKHVHGVIVRFLLHTLCFCQVLIVGDKRNAVCKMLVYVTAFVQDVKNKHVHVVSTVAHYYKGVSIHHHRISIHRCLLKLLDNTISYSVFPENPLYIPFGYRLRVCL